MKRSKRRLRKLQKLLRKFKERSLRVEPLEDRRLLAVFHISNLADAPIDATVDTLREAIIASNASSENDVINLDPGTYTLSLTGSGGTNGQEGLDLDVWKREGTLTIQGAGAGSTTIQQTQLDRVLEIFGRVDVTLKDLTITGGNNDSSNGGGVYIDHADVTLDNVNLSGNMTNGGDRYGGGFYALGHSTVTLLNNIDISNNFVSGSGGGFWVSEQANVDGSAATSITITNNRAGDDGQGTTRTDRDGGGFYASGQAVVSLNNLNLSNNGSLTVGRRGGGFAAYDRASVTITGTGHIDSNLAREHGGGFYVAGRSTVEISGTTLNNNTAQTGEGGGFRSENATSYVSITDGEISGNSSNSLGGGFRNIGEVVIDNADIHNNISNNQGGGFFSSGGLVSGVTITDSSITENTASSHGGGFVNENGLIKFIGATSISDNVGGNQGGGFRNTGPGQVRFEGPADIKNNTSPNSGGGFITTGEGVIQFLDGGEISGNQLTAAGQQGGGFYTDQGNRIELTNVAIKNNTATGGGGGFWMANAGRGLVVDRFTADQTGEYADGFARVAAGTVVVDGGEISGNTAQANHGGGFYVNMGTVQITGADITGNLTDGSAFENRQGGGFYATGRTAHVSIVDGSVSNNTAYGDGGGFYMNDGTVTIDGKSQLVTVSNNIIQADNPANTDRNNGRSGGGFMLDGTGSVSISNAQIHNNVSTAMGGGFLNVNGVVNLTDVTIQQNTAQSEGGGFANSRGDRDIATATTILTNQPSLRAGAISGNVVEYDNGGGFVNRGFVHIENADITGNTAGALETDSNNVGGGFYSEGFGARAEIVDSHITDNTAYGRGGGFYNQNGDVVIQASDGSAINVARNENLSTNNNSDNQGAGGFWAGGTSTTLLKNVHLTDNVAGGHGGGFQARNESDVTFEGGSITGNTAVTRTDALGGAFRMAESSHVTIKGTAADEFEISNNTVASGGGAFYASDVRNLVMLEHVVIDSNTAQTGVGGGFYNVGALTITDSVVTNNVAADNSGGGIYNTGQIAMTRVNVTGNQALTSNPDPNNTDERRGGGIYTAGAYARIVMEDVHIDSNTAHGGGGGLWSSGGGSVIGVGTSTDPMNPSMTIDDNISNNHVDAARDNQGGAGIHNRDGSLIELTRTSISRNEATGRGGGIWSISDGSQVILDEVTIEANKTRLDGAGIASNSSGSELVIKDSDLTNSWANSVSNNIAGYNGVAGNAQDNFDVRGGGIYADGKVTISDTTINNNQVLADPDNEARNWRGGGLAIASNGDALLTNVTITNNTAYGLGGGLLNEGRTIATNLTVDNNATRSDFDKTYEGGGIYSSGGNAWLEIDGGSISNNSAHGSGGGLRLTSYGKLTDVTIDGNKTEHSNNTNVIGGGVYFSGNEAQLILDNVTVDGNTAGGQGGGFYVSGGLLQMTGGSVSNNVIDAKDSGGSPINRDGGGLFVAGNATLNLSQVDVDNNTASAGGGGFYLTNRSHVTIDQSSIDGNTGTNGSGGGMNIREDAAVYITMTTIDNNRALSYGGMEVAQGIRNYVEMTDSSVSGNVSEANHGGGIRNTATFIATNTKINNNQTLGTGGDNRVGGGVYNTGADAHFVMNGGELSGNKTFGRGGGIYTDNGTTDLIGVTVANNRSTDSTTTGGGGIWMNGNSTTVNLVGSTVSDNLTGGNGGGIYQQDNGTLNVVNSTASGNKTGVDSSGAVVGTNSHGGGIFLNNNSLTANITHSTIANNSATGQGGGIYVGGSNPTVTLTNSIVADNKGDFDNTNVDEDVRNQFTGESVNIVETHVGTAFTDNGTVITGTDPLLGALAANGGPTQTHALTAGSIAIDHASVVSDSGADQRGVARQGSGADVGAFEFETGIAGPALTGFGVTSTTLSGGFESGTVINLAGTNGAGGSGTHTWTVTDRLGNVISSQSGAGASAADTVTLVSGGQYEVRLTVRDAAGNASTQTETIDVANVTNVVSFVDEITPDANISLREAVIAANANFTSLEIIRLAPGVYDLSLSGADNGVDINATHADSGDLDIIKRTGQVIIEGNGTAAQTVLDATNLSHRHFQVQLGTDLTLRNLTLQDAAVTNHGGAIQNTQGKMTLENVVLDNNVLAANLQGGGFYMIGSAAEADLTDVKITNNMADNRGGGFYNLGGSVSISGTSEISGNQVTSSNSDRDGGGFYQQGGSTTITGDFKLENNSALGGGGGFWNGSIGTVDASGATTVSIQGNTAPTRTDGDGGGFDNEQLGTVKLSNFKLDNNGLLDYGRYGGGFNNTNFGQVTLVNGTILGNTARDSGGGFRNDIHGDVTMTDVRIESNSATEGGGFANYANQGNISLTETPAGEVSSLTLNTARTARGGGFYDEGPIEITNVDITYNIAGDGGDDRGGGFFLNYRTAYATLTDVNVTGNQATGQGAGFNIEHWGTADFQLVNNAVINITDNEITVDGRRGGGFAIDDGGEAAGKVLLNGPFNLTGNKSTGNGGGFYNAGGLVVGGSDSVASSIGNNVINNNAANYHGGGFYQDAGGSVVLKNTSITQNSASGHGGGFYTVQGNANVANLFDQAAGEITDLGSVTITNTIDGLNIADNVANTRQANNADLHGGGFYNDSAKITLTNVDITGNEILAGRTHYGGGFYNATHRAEVIITDGHVTGNTAPDHGGGFYNLGTVEFKLDSNSDVQISGNQAVETGAQGGGFYQSNRATTIIPNAVITGNSADSRGGGFNNASSGRVELTNAVITGNSSGERGGGFYTGGGDINNQFIGLRKLDANGLQEIDPVTGLPLEEKESVRITGSANISSNTAANYGGGFAAVGSVYLENAQIAGNSSGNEGGGFWTNSPSATITIDNSNNTINDGNITGNTADVNGGGFVANEARVTILGSASDRVQISANVQNSAVNDRVGGGFYAHTNAVVTLDHIDITGNTAVGDNGGGFAVTNADVHATDITITGNEQQRVRNGAAGGGGFFANGASNVTLENATITQNTASGRGGGFYNESLEANVVITGTARIDDNVSTDEEGGGFWNAGFVDIENGTLDRNTAGTNRVGGGFRSTGTASYVRLTDVHIRNNDSESGGAGGYVNTGQLIITGTDSGSLLQITGNEMTDDGQSGGGIFADSNVRLVITNANVSQNTAMGNGGGIYLGTGLGTLINLTINDNLTRSEAGGLYVGSEQSRVTLSSSGGFQNEIQRNQTRQGAGGAIRNNGGDLTIENTIIHQNIADNEEGAVTLSTIYAGNNDGRNGGGIYSSGNGKLTLIDTSVTDNRGGQGVGLNLRDNTDVIIHGTDANNPVQISDNRTVSQDQVGGGLYVGQRVTLDLQNVAIDGNSSSSNGGGFYSDTYAIITGENVSLSNNMVVGRLDDPAANVRSGGGFYATTVSIVDLTNATIDGNTAGSEGGGFYAREDTRIRLDTVSVSNNVTTENSGGGIRFGNGSTGGARLLGQNVVIDGNQAATNQIALNSDDNNIGGGIYVDDPDTLVDLTRVQITNNAAHGRGGGIYNNQSTVKLTDFAVSKNTSDQGTNESQGRGGGIWNSGGGDITLLRGEIAENESFGHGGGIYQRDNDSSLTATNVTISGNIAGIDQTGGGLIDGRYGGGLWLENAGTNQTISLTHVTITENQTTQNGTAGSGFRIDGASQSLTLRDSIVYGNIRDVDGTPTDDDIYNNAATVTVAGDNVIGTSNGALLGDTGQIISSDPLLGPLANTGGFTRTHALQDGSPAIDAATTSTVTEDQRQIIRILGQADIGAYEVSVTINEVDADTPGADAAEFVELFSIPNKSLDGYVLVFYNGNGDVSYRAFDLDGYSTDANGFFTVGNASVPGVDITFANGTLQNGPDAVALYAGDASDFPNGTPVVVDNTLIDAYVYGDSDPGLIFTEDFAGSGVLNGTSPDARPGTETWIANTLWNADGTKTANGQANAFLPFTPVAGQVYTLSLTVNPDISGSSDWFSIGFSQTANVGAGQGWHTNNTVYGWMLNREDDASSTVIQTFLGPGTASGGNHNLNPDVVGPIEMQVVLDTTAANWTIEWFADGSSLRGPVAFGTNPTINYVGLSGYNTATGSIDNFSLTSPGLLSLLTAGETIFDENGNGNSAGQSMQRVPNGTGPQRVTSNLKLLYPTPAGPGLNPDRTGINSVLSIAASSAIHAEGSGSTYTFIVTRSGDMVGSSTVEYAVSSGLVNPANVADFGGSFPGGSIVFGPLETQKTISITTVSDDNSVEADETFDVRLTRADGGETFDANAYTATGTIENNDTASVSLTPLNAHQDEGTGGTTTAFTFEATLDFPVDGGFSLAFTTNDGAGATAATLADGDYQDNDSSLSFSGTMNEVQTITVLVNHDNKVEADELFNVLLGALTPTLSGVDTADITVDTVAEDGTIVNDDTGMLTITGVSKAEGNSGQTDFDFVVTLSNPVQGGVWVQADTGDGQNVDAGLNATTADNDYDQKTETLMFAGTMSEQKTFTVKVNGDTDFERDEIFEAILSMVAAQGSGVDSADITIVGSPATGLILNDDTEIVETGSGEDDLLDVILSGPDSGTYQLTTDVDGSGGGPFVGAVIPFSGVSSLTFDSLAGNDELRITNPTSPASIFAPTGGIFYNAGDDSDILTLIGGNADTETYWVGTTDPGGDPDRSAAGEGTMVTVDNSGPFTQRIEFTGLEGPIDDTATVGSLTVYGTNDSNTIDLEDGSGNSVTIDNFAALDFANKVDVVINANAADGGGNDAGDTINISYTVAALLLNSVTINGDSGADAFNINASTPATTDLNGNAGADSFRYGVGTFVLDGAIDGGAGSDGFYLDDYTSFRALSLTGIGSVDGYAGADTSSVSALTGGFDNINFLSGTAQGDTLGGANLDTTWKIKNLAVTAPSDDEGEVFDDASMQNLAYTSFESLAGNGSDDKFTFEDQRSISGTLGGGGGEDTLDYSAFTTAVNVDLSANTAFNVAGGLLGGTNGSSIENVLGGSAGDMITGDADENLLGDGGGSDMLDGGTGDDTFLLQPGDGDDDALTDISGNDTVSFGGHDFGGPAGMEIVYAPAGNGIMIDMDLTDTPMDVSMGGSGQNLQLNSNGSGLPSPFENVVGSQFNDMFWIRPQAIGGDSPQNGPPVARNVDGNSPVIGDAGVPPGDMLIFNADGQAVVDTGLSLTASGVGTVNYQSIETVNAYNQGARIVDNGDPGFANVPTTAQSPSGWREIQRAASGNTAAALLAKSFDRDLLVSPKGSGSNRATWTFSGLTPGMDYSIAMAWPQDDSLATNAPIRVLDGGAQLAVLSLDQNSGPNDFQDEGVLWENLGVFRSDSGELVVELSNLANGQVFADAVRVEKYSGGPELRVLVDGNVEVDDPSGELQFSAPTGGTDSKTITIANAGNANLLIYGIELADGSSYSLSGAVASASAGSPTTIAPGLSTTFTVTLDSATAGDKIDAVRIFSNDADENVPLKPGATGIANPTNTSQDVDPFTFALDGSVFSSKIIDDEDPGYTSGGFTEFGVDVGKPAQGYHGDLEYSKVGSGADKAFWEFTNLVPGSAYKVSVSWYADSNRAADAPYTVLDGSRIAGSPFFGGEFAVNQRLSPAVATGSTTFDAGLNFADLGTFTVTGSTLTVRLTDAASDGTKYVIADAARVELVGDDPDVLVEVDAVEIADDTGAVNFGTMFSNETDPALTVKTITITNTSATTALTLGANLTLPTGFSVVPGSRSVATLFDGTNTTPLAPGASASFDLQVSGSAEGTLGGDVSFAVDDDVDENPFDFRVAAEISNLRIIDNGTPATVPGDLTHPADTYSETGTWSGPDGDGYLNDDRYVSATGGSTPNAMADWQFNDLPDGLYEVFVTYHEEPVQGGARRAPFAVYNGPAGSTLLQTVEVNQRFAPFGIHINGVNWKKLGGQFQIDTGTLSVRLSNPASADGFVHADAVMLRRLDGPEIQLVDVTTAATNIADGGAVDFGTGITMGSTAQRTFEIRNLGTATLTLAPPAALSHFLVNGNFTSVAPGGTATFTIDVNTSVLGIFTEELRIASSDQDESIYNVTLSAGVGTFIIDNHDAAWSQTGNWVTQVNLGFDDDISNNAAVGGAVETAIYAFTGVPEGRYRAVATWVTQNNLATNAQYNISGNATPAPGSSLMPVINQKAGPDDLTLAGARWEQLATIDVANSGNPGAVTVVLTSAGANNFVYADAIALVPLSGPQIVVTDLGPNEAAGGGDDVVLSGGELVNLGGQTTRTIQIENVGVGPLTLGNPSLPANFSITATDPFENTVAQNGTETFQIQYNGTDPGTFGGLVSIGTNDTENDPFTFQVSATIGEAVQIIDNKDPGFSQHGFTEFGRFTNQFSQGYKDTIHYSRGGSGADVATWAFSGLPDGTYLVSATWYPDSNRATDSPFSISASGGDSGQLDVNQQLAPNDFTDAGVGWENLGAIRVTGGGGLLTVTLTDDVVNNNRYVIADAIRIEPITTPEIQVTDLGANGAVGGGDDVALNDGGAVDFGVTAQNVEVERTLQIENTGEGTLNLSNLSVTGANFSIAPGGDFSQTALGHGDTATITIHYSAASQGTSSGTVAFDNNDSDETPFNFDVTGRVSEGGVLVIDNGNTGWTGPGFTKFERQGFADDSDGIHDIHYSQVGKGKTATWTFTGLVPGTYRVSTSYYPHSNRATASPFTVYDSNGTSVLATTYVNQQLAPNDFGDLGVMWEDLAGGVVITGSTLTVKLSDNAPGQSGTRYVIADAVRVEKIQDSPEIELRDQTGGANVQSGTAINFGTVFEGATVTRDLLIKNVGSATLHVNDVSLNNVIGNAFSLTTDPDPINGDGNIADGTDAGFQISLNTSAPGTYTATLTIDNTDADEGMFTVNLTATIDDVAVIDNGDPGFTAPLFTRFGPPTNVPQGFQGDMHYRVAESSIFTATWTFTNLPSGSYQVAATWPADPNRAYNSPFRVLDGATQQAQTTVNQRIAPQADQTVGTTPFEELAMVNISSGTLTVKLGTTTTGYVIADAIRIERLSPLLATSTGDMADGAGGLSDTDAAAALDAAVAAWTAVDPSAAPRLAGVDVRIADLPDDVLGLASEHQSRIWLDANAAGHGWNVSGASRVEIREPGTSGVRLRSTSGSQLSTLSSQLSFDLLTVVTHELGHVLGLPDLDPLQHADDVMAGRLDTGARRSPLGPVVEPAMQRPVDPADAERAMAQFSDHMFMDLGHFESRSGDGMASLFEDRAERPEATRPDRMARHARTELALDAVLRIDDEDSELTAARHDSEEVIDRLFSGLVDGDGDLQDEIL